MNPNYTCSHCKGNTVEIRDNRTIQEKQVMKDIHNKLPEIRVYNGEEYAKNKEPLGLCCYACNPKRSSGYVIVNYNKQPLDNTLN